MPHPQGTADLAKCPEFQSDVLVGGLKTGELHEKYSHVSRTMVKDAARMVRFLDENGFLIDSSGLAIEPTSVRRLTPAQQRKQELREAVLIPPVDIPPPHPQLIALQNEVALLRDQLRWSDHANSPERQGGTVTINHSDCHHGDRAHMLDCHRQMVDKSFQLLHLYQPKRIVMMSNGDKIAGRGIYRNQNMDAVVQTTREQRQIGVVNVVQWNERLKTDFPGASVEWRFTHGNHDVNEGERITPDLVYALRSFGVNAIYHGDEAILNLADAGAYLAYFEHGTGYSDISPSSPKWWRNMVDKLLRLSRKYHGDNRIRRVGHGHTHWFSVNMERSMDVFVDTTGGCQRNERVLLGKNNRPMGWIAYVSPKGYDDILDPIPIQPELETVERELEDPYLFHRNMEAAAADLRAYREMELAAGIIAPSEDVPEGR
jgi:hypothetical protein